MTCLEEATISVSMSFHAVLQGLSFDLTVSAALPSALSGPALGATAACITPMRQKVALRSQPPRTRFVLPLCPRPGRQKSFPLPRPSPSNGPLAAARREEPLTSFLPSVAEDAAGRTALKEHAGGPSRQIMQPDAVHKPVFKMRAGSLPRRLQSLHSSTKFYFTTRNPRGESIEMPRIPKDAVDITPASTAVSPSSPRRLGRTPAQRFVGIG
ncbi:uncharacterized protein LOC119593634 [Penaeus monodon]|uniref:uncharacterized protein LOC119593634 n=1 Tax=Penaeus monodon TaxID=6687 RepID=UPI0018A723A2|nr:uncharacterized protein LOC119593634 [Penaeus monodon]